MFKRINQKSSFARLAVGFLAGLTILLHTPIALAAGGISASGGGKVVVGQTFTVTVTASGANFDSLQGKISVSGPVQVVSFSAGSATWLPGKSPANNNTFVGIVSATNSLTVASIKLKATKEGSGSVTVSGVRLARSGAEVGSAGGSASFTVGRAPTPPGAVSVTSSTNPDQEQAYGVATVQLAWTAPSNGATGYATVFDQTADSTPPQTANTSATTASYDNLNLGTYYFHIRATNADGWGPTTHFKVTINRSVDSSLAAPTITGITKLSTFKNDVTTGTITGFQVAGSSTGLTDFTVTLTFVPASLPAEQKIEAAVGAEGSWAIDFDQPIPSGFYKVTAQATKDKVTTPSSTPVNIELSVANGGTAKMISEADLPQPDRSVTVAGIKFVDKSQLNRGVLLALGLMIALAALALGVYWVVKKSWSRKKARPTPTPSSRINF